jgi:hypothetical protein
MKISTYLLICGLFNDAASSSDYAAPNYLMINERWIGKEPSKKYEGIKNVYYTIKISKHTKNPVKCKYKFNHILKCQDMKAYTGPGSAVKGILKIRNIKP